LTEQDVFDYLRERAEDSWIASATKIEDFCSDTGIISRDGQPEAIKKTRIYLGLVMESAFNKENP